MYPSLVEMFYSNLYYIYGNISFEVIKHKIFVPLEEFDEALDLLCTKPLFKLDEPKESNI